MRTADLDIILVPGGPVGDGHWIARWGRNLKTARMLSPPGPGSLDLNSWQGRLVDAAETGDRPRLIIGHGLGATLTALAARRLGDIPIAGAVLVAPHDPEITLLMRSDDMPPPALPAEPFGFPAMVIATRNHPHMAFGSARERADCWGAVFVDAGEAGVIDDTTGHGPWPERLMRLGRFLKRL